MQYQAYALILLASMGGFYFFNEVFLVPYQTARDYSELSEKLREPMRAWITLIISLLDYGLICLGTWAGYKMTVLYQEDLEQNSSKMIGQGL